MSRAPRALVDWLTAGVIGALVFAWFGHAFLNYDTFYALVWGSDLAHGRTPDYTIPVAPTPHPLAQAVGVVLAPFGAGAEGIMLAIGLLALGMLVVGLFRLGQELFGVWAGLLAAAIIVTRVPILSYGIRGYVDLPTAAFVVWAAVLEARRPRRGTPVLVLLTLAGLLRPEGWLYAAAYWLWLVVTAPDRSRLVQWTLLAAAAPVIWILSDWLISGSPIHSLTGTHDVAAQLHRKSGLTALPSIAPRRLGEILRLEVLLAAVIGFIFTVKYRRERAYLPLTIGVLNGLAYAAFAAAQLPLLGRYLFVAAAMLALFAGAGALGWLSLPGGDRGRRIWQGLGIATLAALVVLFPLQQTGRLDLLKDDIANRARIQLDLKHLVQEPGVERALRACPRVYVATHRTVPLVALYAGIPATRVTEPTGNVTGCAVIAANAQVNQLAVLDPGEPESVHHVAAGSGAHSNRSWIFAPRARIQAS